MIGKIKKTGRALIKALLNRLLSKPQVWMDRRNLNESKTLVLMLTHLGDCVIHFPFLHALLAHRKFAMPIHLVVKHPLQEIFADSSNLGVTGFRCPWVGAGNWVRDFGGWVKLVLYLRREKFDLVIVTHPHFLTSLTARLSGAAHSIGYVEDGDCILNQGFSFPHEDHVSRRSDWLLKQLDIESVGRTDWHPFDPEKILNGREVIRSTFSNGTGAGNHKTPFICLHPGAGGAAKIWPWRNFVAFLGQVATMIDFPVILVGGPGEIETCGLICAAMRDHCTVFDLSGRLDVAELFGVFGEAAIYVGNDSGPTHLAAASGIPVFTIFGPASKPEVWKPSGPSSVLCHIEGASFYEDSSVRMVVEHFEAFLENKVFVG